MATKGDRFGTLLRRPSCCRSLVSATSGLIASAPGTSSASPQQWLQQQRQQQKPHPEGPPPSQAFTASGTATAAIGLGLAVPLGLLAAWWSGLVFGRRDKKIGDDFAVTSFHKAKDGAVVRIRLATLDDLKCFLEDIQDSEGVGSGAGDDSYVIQQFKQWVSDQSITLLWAEAADGKPRGLGLIAIGWCPDSQSYWHSLRVGQEARGKGVAGLLFREAARLAVRFQGPESVARWGIVSNNSIMTEWSARMGLAGGEVFIRHMGKPKASAEVHPDALPEGWTMRAATTKDVKLIVDHAERRVGQWEVCRSDHGTQNFVGSANWCPFSKEVLDDMLCGGRPTDNPKYMGGKLLFDASGALVAFASIGVFTWGPKKFLFHSYSDGTKEGLKLMFDLLLYDGKGEGCDFVMGYVPKIDWLVDIFTSHEAYDRATKTEQWEYHWRNADYA